MESSNQSANAAGPHETASGLKYDPKRGKGENYAFAGKARGQERLGEQSFIAKLNLASFAPLEKMDAKGRGACEKCKACRKFFCYDCMEPLENGEGVPRLKLPVDVTM